MTRPLPTRAYFVCCNARTGSSLLLDILRQTGVAGNPFPYFRPGGMALAGLRQIIGVSMDEPFTGYRNWRERILLAGSQNGDIFSTKLFPGHVPNAIEAFSQGHEGQTPSLVEALAGYFSDVRLIWLRRANLVAQAVSHYAAIKSGEWFALPGERPSIDLENVAPYDFLEIDALVAGAASDDALWGQILEGSTIPILSLTYEELAADMDGTTRDALRFLGLSDQVPTIPATVRVKQATDWSLELERRYRAERSERGAPPADAMAPA